MFINNKGKRFELNYDTNWTYKKLINNNRYKFFDLENSNYYRTFLDNKNFNYNFRSTKNSKKLPEKIINRNSYGTKLNTAKYLLTNYHIKENKTYNDRIAINKYKKQIPGVTKNKQIVVFTPPCKSYKDIINDLSSQTSSNEFSNDFTNNININNSKTYKYLNEGSFNVFNVTKNKKSLFENQYLIDSDNKIIPLNYERNNTKSTKNSIYRNKLLYCNSVTKSEFCRTLSSKKKDKEKTKLYIEQTNKLIKDKINYNLRNKDSFLSCKIINLKRNSFDKKGLCKEQIDDPLNCEKGTNTDLIEKTPKILFSNDEINSKLYTKNIFNKKYFRSNLIVPIIKSFNNITNENKKVKPNKKLIIDYNELFGNHSSSSRYKNKTKTPILIFHKY